MTKYLLIESRDPFDSNDVEPFYVLAQNLVTHGNRVTLFLTQNGVLPARHCEASPALTELTTAGIEVLADGFSLDERGIGPDQLAEGVRPAGLEIVIDHMAGGGKAIWH